MQPADNKRRFPRIPAEHAVLVRTAGEGVSEGFAKTRDVGLGGCMFVNPVAFGEDAPVELLISVNLAVVRVRGRVVYELPADGGGFEVGVEFLEIDDGDRRVLETLFQPSAD